MKSSSKTIARHVHPLRTGAARRRDARALARSIGHLTPSEAQEWAAILGRYEAEDTSDIRRVVEPRMFEAFGERPGSIAQGMR